MKTKEEFLKDYDNLNGTMWTEDDDGIVDFIIAWEKYKSEYADQSTTDLQEALIQNNSELVRLRGRIEVLESALNEAINTQIDSTKYEKFMNTLTPKQHG